jgi:hypothetical protein
MFETMSRRLGFQYETRPRANPRRDARISTDASAQCLGYMASSGGRHKNTSTLPLQMIFNNTVNFATKIDLRRPLLDLTLTSAQCSFGFILTKVLSFARVDGHH